MFDPEAEKTVYFVRHGQSEDNVAPVYQSPHSKLSDLGRGQAQSIAARAQRIKFEALISSPLTRARDTAEAIAHATGKQPEFSELFVEAITPDGVRGKPYEDPVALALWRQWQESLKDTGPKVGNGEDFLEMIKRADDALAFLLAREEKTMLVVTHGYFMRAIIARIMLGESLTAENFISFQNNASMANTGVSVIQYAAGPGKYPLRWKLWTYNDHAHLG